MSNLRVQLTITRDGVIVETADMPIEQYAVESKLNEDGRLVRTYEFMPPKQVED